MDHQNRLSFDGAWKFYHDASGQTALNKITAWRTATVPMPWQAQFDDLRQASGVAWYKRSFTLPPAWEGAQAAILHFGAVDYHAVVWVNGKEVGQHLGGYLPFEFDIAKRLRPGENEIVVQVIDSNDDRSRYAAYPFSEIPHGKQSWYGPISGIWQSVWLEMRPALHISSLKLTPDVATATLAIQATLSDKLGRGTLQASVFDPSGKTIAAVKLNRNGYGVAKLGRVKLVLWNPDAPSLYGVEATLVADGAQHSVSATCGFRTVEARNGRIYLNGQPIYLRGVLDQAYYPKTIYTPPSLEFLEDQARKAKALGLNCLRTHIKIEDPAYYDVADRFGLLVWTEIPNWVLLSEETKERAAETLRGMVERDWNHPSIIAWTLINENWGTDLVHNASHRQWLADFYHQAKEIDPTRLIVDNSACPDNFHVAGDLEDYHHYRAIPDHAKEWDAWVADFASRQNSWVWHKDFAHERRADLPLLVSEFGNWGLPNPDLLHEDNKAPWWFETGHEWGEGIVYPHGMRQRYDFWQMDRVFGSFESFVRQVQEHMARSLHYEISTMRLHPSIAGYVITEFTDVHWECNGLLDMQRNVKQGIKTIFTPINQDRVVVLRPQRWSARPGERVQIEVCAFTVDGAGSQGLIRWQVGKQKGELAAPGGVIEVTLDKAGMVNVQARWVNINRTLASNSVDLACVEAPHANKRLCVLGDTALAQSLARLGWIIVEESLAEATSSKTLIVSHVYTKELAQAVQDGARVLILAGPEFAKSLENVRLPGTAVAQRAGTPWQGDWATAFSWIRKQGPFAALPGSPLLEMEYADLSADAVLVGLPAWAMRNHSWAGLALGWIHKPVSLLAEMPYGRGHLTVTTFKLNAETLADNVLAQAIFAGCTAL